MQEKRNFTGGQNSDKENRVVPAGDYRKATNCRIGVTAQGNNMAIENVMGNTLIPYSFPGSTSAINKTIGSKEDYLTSTVTYFVYNSENYHSILQWNWITNVISKIAQGIALNFNVDHKITGINLIGDLLYWTEDNWEEPKKINYVQAIAGTGAYANVDGANTFTTGQLNLQEYIYALKTPPLYPPSVIYETDATRNTNYMTGFLFQFKYRFLFDDHEKSAFSPISLVALPALNTAFGTGTILNNKIKLGINTGTAIVYKIEIAMRIGNTGDFQSIVVLDKKDQFGNIPDAVSPSVLNYDFGFYNDGVYNNVDLRDSDKLFDNVPQLASSQELIEPTRISYGDCTDGYDPVPIVAELDVEFKDIVLNTWTIRCQANSATSLHSGGVRIRSPWTDGVDNQGNIMCQPIWNTNGNATVFGGTCVNRSGDGHLKIGVGDTNLIGSYNQILPLGGFVFYLAGTNNYGISRQHFIDPGGSTMSNSADGSYFILNGTEGNNPSPGCQSSLNNINFYLYQGLVYSDVSISNVAAGDYVLRVADHVTKASQLNDTALAYQKKSTYTVQIGGVSATELRLSITDTGVTATANVNGTIVNVPITVTGNVIDIGETVILDMTESRNVRYSNCINGYAYDHDLSTMELSKIDITADAIGGAFNNALVLANSMNPWNSNTPYMYADHNGFYFFGRSYSVTTGTNTHNVQATQLASGVISTTSLTYSPVPSGPWREANHGQDITPIANGLFNASRTILTANVVESGAFPLQNIAVTVTRGKFALTGSDGIAKIIIYSDTSIANVRKDFIYYKTENKLFFDSYIPPNDYFDIAFGIVGSISGGPNYAGVYNFTFPIVLQTVIAKLIGQDAASSNLKRGGTYQYGIVYYDHGNRSGTTNTNNLSALTTAISGNKNGLRLYVPFYTELNPATGAIYGGEEPTVDWSIYNQPPAWATHYQWVRTKNSANNRYLQFIVDALGYTDNNGVSTTYGSSNATRINFELKNITDYNANNANPSPPVDGIGIVYDWINKPSDDHVRLIRDSNGIFYSTYIDTQVVNYKPTSMTLVIQNSPSIPNLGFQNGLLFEVYNPKLQVPANEELFWEIGECYEVGDAGLSTRFHKGPTTDQAGPFTPDPTTGTLVSATPATGTFIGGDTYYRIRNMLYQVPTSSAVAYKTYIIEDASVSDFYPSMVSDIGRENKFDPDERKVRRLSTIFFSEIYIPETNVNGLSNIYDLNFEEYELRYGAIKKLYNEDHRLNVLQQLKCGQIPVNQNIVFDNQGNQQVMTTEKVLNQIVYYKGEYGIGDHPESFAVYGGLKFFIDANRLAILQLANNGIVPVSENEMYIYFVDLLEKYRNDKNSFIYGVIDVAYSNYIAAFETITDSPGVTEAYTYDTNRWQQGFSYLPDFMCASGKGLVSFKNGQLYLHDSNTLYNNFYGVQYNSEIDLVGNADPASVKVLQAISEETPEAWTAEITTPNGQLTNVRDQDFSLRENLQYAEVWRDANTPNIVNPEINGDMMRDQSFLVKLTNKLTTFTKLIAVNFMYAKSERSGK